MLERNAHSTIISLPLASEVYEKLIAADIIFAIRGSGSRFSFHFYNTHADLNHLIAVLDGKS
ncbi:hypothetical protein D3C86_2158250 [compost metagenome]